MIKPSTEYALSRDGLVVAKGSASKMRRALKTASANNKRSTYKIWNSPSSKVGDKIPR